MERVGIIAVKFEKTMWLALPSLWSRRRRRKRRKRAIGAGAGVGWFSPHANSRHSLHWNTCSVSGFLVVFFFFMLQLCTSRTSMALPNSANYFKLQNSVGAKFCVKHPNIGANHFEYDIISRFQPVSVNQRHRLICRDPFKIIFIPNSRAIF